MKVVITVIGTRPEVVKMAPVIKELDKRGDHILIDSGQHYDDNLDKIFYESMQLREPDHRFDLRGSTSVEHISETMKNCKDIMRGARLVVVLGDPNTALAGALTANKLGIPIAHIEAGLRSYDRRMPEEHNRVMIDHISDLLFTPSEDASQNLLRENIWTGIRMVGNPVTDALQSVLPRVPPAPGSEYVVVTLHRAENMEPLTVTGVFSALGKLRRKTGLGVVFPMHPRTVKFMHENNLSMNGYGFIPVEPMDYMTMLSFVRGAKAVLTDSGGLQEEACYLHVPCVTLRESTERPETVRIGANRLALQPDEILRAVDAALNSSRVWDYPYGDGTSAKQIAEVISRWL